MYRRKTEIHKSCVPLYKINSTLTNQFVHSDGGFAQGQIVGIIRAPGIDEASGCAASRTHPGLLYTLNDHGGNNEVFVVATNGTLVATYTILGSRNEDWEDIAIGPCDNSNSTADCIYIGKCS